jgi:hypothetical protein
VDTGLNMGTRGGIQAVEIANCVPQLPAPQPASVDAPNFDGEAPAGKTYHVGVGISDPFVNTSLYQAHQAGALCLAITGSNVELLNTGLMKTLLPSLGVIATRDGKDAPMMVAMRPATVPTVSIGAGTVDPTTKKLVKPLIELAMKDLNLDFYAMIDDRYARVFTLTADVAIPLAIIAEDCSKLTPVLGDLQQLITNVRSSNSEIITEEELDVLNKVLPTIMTFAEPALAKALGGFPLPELSGLKMKIVEAKGLANVPGTEKYQHIGVYAELMAPGASCAVASPLTTAALTRVEGPTLEEIRSSPKPIWPTAYFAVTAEGIEGTPEFAFRVDDGMWTSFVAAKNGVLEVSHPRLLIEGSHRVQIRSRVAEAPHGISSPVAVTVVIDYTAPEVSFIAHRESNQLEVRARDVVSAPQDLTYAYQVGDGAMSSFGAARLIDLAAIEAAGGLTVQVRDQAGLIGEASYGKVARAGVGISHSVAPTASANASEQTAGCSTVPGSLGVVALGALSLLLRRRRSDRA